MTNKKIPFTPFQLVLTILNLSLFAFCILGDILILISDDIKINYLSYKINLAISVPASIVSLLLIFNVRKINTFGDNVNSDCDRTPAIMALRTYFCMLFFDVAGVMTLMFVGPLFLDNAKTIIMIFAPIMFILSAVVYFIKVGKIGLEDFSDDDGDKAEKVENKHTIIDNDKNNDEWFT